MNPNIKKIYLDSLFKAKLSLGLCSWVNKKNFLLFINRTYSKSFSTCAQHGMEHNFHLQKNLTMTSYNLEYNYAHICRDFSPPESLNLEILRKIFF